ncbi:hypothetical protein K474DRAFT_1596562 [Panus rudis PR-1116 ss-1]|nr:hypothetical protein K474DRAFT_1596562 [Panus rudis PR-1116 ss-1]
MDVIARVLSSFNFGGLTTLVRVPGAVKWVVAALFLLNVRSWPGVWHYRIYVLAWTIRIRFALVKLGLLLRLHPRPRRKALEDKWFEDLSPIGQNPLTWVKAYKSWAGPDDSDFNLHLSNSSYAKNLDMARFDASLAINTTLFRCGGWVALGATHFKFVREIPMFSIYEMRTSIATWDNKWIYVVTRYVTHPKNKKKSSKSSTPNGTPTPKVSLTPPSEPSGAPIASLHTPSDPSLTREPAETGLRALANAAASQVEPDGAILHCVAISECCFKIGRITVPPTLVLASEGFASPPSPSSYSHRNPPPHITHLRHYRSSQNLKSLMELMKGGWREVKEDERWWEKAFEGVVEQGRKRNLELVRGVHDGMENARALSA